jgi:hypothetical protein
MPMNNLSIYQVRLSQADCLCSLFLLVLCWKTFASNLAEYWSCNFKKVKSDHKLIWILWLTRLSFKVKLGYCCCFSKRAFRLSSFLFEIRLHATSFSFSVIWSQLPILRVVPSALIMTGPMFSKLMLSEKMKARRKGISYISVFDDNKKRKYDNAHPLI